jgi:hypothetical protein
MVLTGRTTTHASESGHWYAPDGTPRYEVMGKNGNMRPATLRDARKMGWYPGVTSIIKCAAAPGLESWKQNQVLLAALTLPRSMARTTNRSAGASWRTRASRRARRASAAPRSTPPSSRHYEGKPPSQDMLAARQGHRARDRGQVRRAQMWTSEKPCAHPIGYGTKADLHCEAPIVLDFKGSDFDEDGRGT